MNSLNKQILLGLCLVPTVWASGGNRGGRDNGPIRQEIVKCGVQLPGTAGLQGEQTAVVQNAQALVQGEVGTIKFVFSVRGKTAVAKLTDTTTGYLATARGAIEMLRHGGRATSLATVQSRDFGSGWHILKRGDDDANDGAPEKEAGFELSLTHVSGAMIAALKCESTNQR